MPSVSIIIPCHNAGRWLSGAIASSLAQTAPEKEIIVVDDGSTDESAEIAGRYASQGVRLVSQSNQGASAARNHGLRLARGDFLQYLDADDLLAPDKIEVQMMALSRMPGYVATGAWGRFRATPGESSFPRESIWRDADPVDWLASSWTGEGMMHPAAWLVPSSVAAAAGGWDESLSLDDDGEYFCRIVLRSRGVRFVENARSFYRVHDGPRLSASVGRRAAESSFRACESKERLLLAVEDSARVRRAIAANYSRYAWEQIPYAPDLAEEAVRRWKKYGPDVPVPRAGRMYNLAASLVGWRLARRLQEWLKRRPA